MIVKIFTVNCDRCGWWIAEADSVSEARAEAKRSGWRRIKGEDVCPRCVTDEEARR